MQRSVIFIKQKSRDGKSKYIAINKRKSWEGFVYIATVICMFEKYF